MMTEIDQADNAGVHASAPRLVNRVRSEIQTWFEGSGEELVIYLAEFCQGNRAALSKVMAMVKELAAAVFAPHRESLSASLLEDLEYRVFDLIGEFSSTPGQSQLKEAIKAEIVDCLTVIFVSAKQKWNLDTYKLAESFEEIDPFYSLIPNPENIASSQSDLKKSRRQARMLLDELVTFTKHRLRGSKNRVIAVSWLENPRRQKDFGWLASLSDSTTGSVKVTLTRFKQFLARNYDLRNIDDELVLREIKAPAKNAS